MVKITRVGTITKALPLDNRFLCTHLPVTLYWCVKTSSDMPGKIMYFESIETKSLTDTAGKLTLLLINSQSFEDTQVGYISQKYNWDKYT